MIWACNGDYHGAWWLDVDARLAEDARIAEDFSISADEYTAMQSSS